MVKRQNWVVAIASLAVAFGLAAAGCGSQPATKPPARADASRPDAETVIVPEEDAGTFHGFDGGIQKDTARMLNVVGDPHPILQYGETHTLTALLVSVGVGSVPNETVTFVLEGAGTLETQIAQTNAAGLVQVQFTAPLAIGTARVTASSAKVAAADQAVWIIDTKQPVRKLEPLSSTTVTLASNSPATIIVRLNEPDPTQPAMYRPLAGGTLNFDVIGSRGNALLNHRDVDADTIVTGVDGVARLTLSVTSVAAEYGFSIVVSEQYASSLTFKVTVKKDIACTKDADCRATERCDTASRKCVPKPQCTVPSDCNQGFTCSGGQCVPNITCTQNSECAAGWTCDPVAKECVPPKCQSDQDCTAPKFCDPTTQTCLFPTQKLCSTDADCPTNYRCDGVRCVSKGSSGKACASSAECAMGEYCNPNTGTCTAGCDSNSGCGGATPICDPTLHICVAGCTEDWNCFPQVCDPATGTCMDAPVVIYDVGGQWKAVQTFHLAGLTPANVQSTLSTIDTIFSTAQAIVDCHVSQYLPGWVQMLIGDAVDDAVCGVVGDYVPDWVQQVAHIGADVSTVIQTMEIHSDMNIVQPGAGQTDRHTVSGVDDWKKAYFFWYTTTCKTPAPGAPPPQCARVEVDLIKAAIHPTPSQFTGRVDDSTLHIDTHNVNFKFGKAVMYLIDLLVKLETKGKYTTLEAALGAVVDCAKVNTWIQDVVADILGPDLAQYASMIDVTGVCNSAKNSLIQQLINLINGLNSDVPMSLTGKAGVVLLPGNTSNVADRLAPGVWYGKFDGQGDENHQFGEWYADRP
ncbi:MAG TPA: hypothetical protein VGK67_22415 [Myxococcales bacterium]|jgi:hypothetical protein